MKILYYVLKTSELKNKNVAWIIFKSLNRWNSLWTWHLIDHSIYWYFIKWLIFNFFTASSWWVYVCVLVCDCVHIQHLCFCTCFSVFLKSKSLLSIFSILFFDSSLIFNLWWLQFFLWQIQSCIWTEVYIKNINNFSDNISLWQQNTLKWK